MSMPSGNSAVISRAELLSMRDREFTSLRGLSP